MQLVDLVVERLRRDSLILINNAVRKGRVRHPRGRPKSGLAFSDARKVALRERTKDGGTRLRKVASALVEKAISGDVQAIKAIADRLDGRSKSTIDSQVELKSQPILMRITPEHAK